MWSCNASAVHAAGGLVSDRTRLVRSEYRTFDNQDSSLQVHLTVAGAGEIVTGHPTEAGDSRALTHDHTSTNPKKGFKKGKAKAKELPLGRLLHDKIQKVEAQLVRSKRAMAQSHTRECAKSETGCNDFCLDDYPLGVPDTNRCIDSDYHSAVLDSAMCEEAARQANASKGWGPSAPFMLTSEYFDFYPQGCFKLHGHGAYFFNPVGTYPRWPMGIPICYRVKYANGTTDANDGCPSGFQKIETEERCLEAAYCQGFCTQKDDFQRGTSVSSGPDTRPADASNYDIRPRGCFIHPEDECVYFNVPRDRKSVV